ncbi:MAG: PqqD family protein [Cyanobacteria bacterium SZAS TMP-1]|nr:PqqD family protein [Cyanobacteria bacterium SZAS TMP-1]
MRQATPTLQQEKQVTIERLRQLAMSDAGFIFDPQTGQSFTVNKTGHLVINMLKDDATIEATARELSERCDKPYELVLCCVEAFIMQLNRYL